MCWPADHKFREIRGALRALQGNRTVAAFTCRLSLTYSLLWSLYTSESHGHEPPRGRAYPFQALESCITQRRIPCVRARLRTRPSLPRGHVWSAWTANTVERTNNDFFGCHRREYSKVGDFALESECTRDYSKDDLRSREVFTRTQRTITDHQYSGIWVPNGYRSDITSGRCEMMQ